MVILKERVTKVVGDKVHENWFIGPDEDHLQKAGALIFAIGEYQIIGAALLLGADQVNKTDSRFRMINDDKIFREYCKGYK